MNLEYGCDIEIYPNFFSACFVGVETGTEIKFIRYIENDKIIIDDTPKLVRFLSLKNTLIGYNFINFDMPILLGICDGMNQKETYNFALRIIKNDYDDRYYNYLKLARKYPILDLMKMLDLDKTGISLKQIGILLKYPKIEELPIPPEMFIRKNDIETIIDYNFNDVYITIEFYKKLGPQIEIRKWASQEYGVDLINASDSRMANVILTQLYLKKVNKNYNQLKNSITYRDKIVIEECIAKNINFTTLPFQKLLSQLKNTVLVAKNAKGKFTLKEKINYEGVTYNFGVGGLHSKDEPGKFKSNNETVIIDADVSSYYAYAILNNEICPAHLDKKVFYNIYEKLVKERIEAKNKGDLTKAQVLKILILSFFGKFGSNYFWLYDLKAFYSITISGQLYLFMLIEMLNENGFEIISANTDGIVCKIYRNKLDKYYEVCKSWQEKTGFDLEFNIYEKYIRRDVNNYIAKSENGKVKTKGIFEIIDPDEVSDIGFIVSKKFNMPILPKALKNYFIDGISVEQTVKSSTSIHDFITTHKPDTKFEVYLKKGNEYILQQRINRYYMSLNNTGQLLKKDPHSNRETLFCANHSTCILNEINKSKSIEHYEIDFNYYIKEINKIIEIIEPKTNKLELF